MNRFEYVKVSSINQAVEMMNSTVPEAIVKKTTTNRYVVKAGGIDLLDLLKEGIVSPDRIIDLCNIPGMGELEVTDEGLRIGPLVTIADLEEREEVRKHYPALQQAAAAAATPQIRNMATLGGNLMQRPRCWYFRSKDHHCRKKGGTTCFAQIGQNQFHGIFNTSICPAVHASSLATALLAYQGRVELTGPEGKRVLPLEEFFTPSEEEVTRENVAGSKEIITAILLPPVASNTLAAYLKQGQRESHDWSIGDVAVVMEMNGSSCREARVVFGAASSVPLRREKAETVLSGKEVTEEVAIEAAEQSVEGATPLKYNAYKVPLFRTLVYRTVLRALGKEPVAPSVPGSPGEGKR